MSTPTCINCIRENNGFDCKVGVEVKNCTEKAVSVGILADHFYQSSQVVSDVVANDGKFETVRMYSIVHVPGTKKNTINVLRLHFAVK